MDPASWKSLWGYVFAIASIMFYVTVIVVAFKGAGDVTAMVKGMISARRNR